MNVTFQSTLVTEGKEERVSGNHFRITETGYVLYPMNTLIDMKRTEKTTPVARIMIEEIQWKNNETVISYEVKSLITLH